MALTKQNFTLQMGQGVDTKADPKQVVAGKLLELENATFQSTNRLTKRPGTAELSASATLSAGNAIQSFQGELVAMDGKSLNSYSQTTDSFINKGSKLALDLAVTSVVKDSFEQKAPDSSINGGVALYAWENYNGAALDAVGYSIVDVATSQVLTQSKLTAGTAKPKVMNVAGYILLLYADGSNLKALAFDSASPLAAPSAITIGTLNAAGVYDACELINALGASDGLIVARTNSTNQIRYQKIDTSLVVGAAVSYAANATYLSVFCNTTTNNAVRIMFYDGTAVQVLHDTLPFGSQSGPYTIETIANVVNITGTFVSGSNCQYFYEIDNTITNLNADNFVRTNTVSGTTVGTASDFMRSVCLWSKPWLMSGTIYVCCVHDSPLQATYFVFDVNGKTVAKIAPSNGGGQSTNRLLREVNPLSANAYQMPYLFKDLVESVNGDVYTQTGVNSVTMTLQTPLVSESLGNNLNVSGGIVSAYDGQTIAEQNFNLYPEETSVSFTSFGGNLGQGSYQYTALYEWTDAQGQLHQSNTSVPVTVDTTFKTTYFKATNNSNVTDTTDGVTTTTLGSVIFDYTPFTYPADNLQVGQQIIGPNIPANSYINNIIVDSTGGSPDKLDRIYAILNQQCTGSPSNPTDQTGSGFSFYGASTIGSQAIGLLQNYSATYTGNFTAGSNVVKMNTVIGLHIGQTISWAGSQFGTSPSRPFPTITAVDQINKTITLSVTASSTISGQSIIVNNYYNVNWAAAAVNYFDITLASNDVPFFVGQRLYTARTTVGHLLRVAPSQFWSYPTAYGSIPVVTITSWTLTSGTTYRVFLNTNKIASGSPQPDILLLGMTQWHLIQPGATMTATANFAGNLVIQSVDQATVYVDQQASASGSMALQTQIGSTATVTVPTLRITDKPTSKPISIAVYRTQVNQSLFYRITSFTTPILNDKTIDRITFVDNSLDTSIIGNEQLYTTGGVLANASPPALTQLAQYKNRLIGISSEDPYTWYFSKQVTTNVPVQFTPYFYKKIPELGGGLTALGVMDDKLVFFKKSSIFVVVGLGPNNLGLQDDFNDAELVTTDTGCTEPKSIIRTPLGLMYKSGKGIYLLDRGLNVKYVGAPVEAYNANLVTGAELIENVNQVRFTLNNGVALVYDYYFDQWSVFTNVNAVDTCLFQSKFTYLRGDGRIFKESPGSWVDGGLPIYLRLKTSWLSLNGLQGFERIYNIMVLGDYKSPHTLTAKVAHDFSSSVSQTTAIPVAVSPGVYQYKVYMTRQKTDAMQFELVETQPGPFYGEGLDISAITLQVGVKSGTNKLPAGKLYG